VLWGVRLQSALLFAAGFSGWISPAWAAAWFIGTFILAGVAGNAITAFWMGWMGDLIPSSSRGRHFAWRNVAFAWVYLACSLGAGWLSRSFTSGSAPWIWFGGLFALSSLARFLSYLFMTRQYEPPTITAVKIPSPLKYRPDPAFLKFCFATALFQGSASMSGPFFNVWYLRDLQWDFFKFSIAAACTILGSILFTRHWGHLADARGTTSVIRLSGLGICLVPFPYLFLENPFILWSINIYAGAFWAGYNLATFNYLLHATDHEKNDQGRRNQNIAFAALMTGISAFGFSLLGGYLADALPILNGYRLRSVFLASTLMRLAIWIFLFPSFREYQQGLPAPSSPLWMEFPGIRAGLGVFRVVYRGFRNQ
jgi:MFS family permease